MIVVWALLYFPASHPEGGSYDERIAQLDTPQVKAMRGQLDAMKQDPTVEPEKVKALEEKVQPVDDEINKLRSEWSEQSCLGRMGKWIEPAVEPLGWDWRVGMAALASFPAREVLVGTLGLIYSQGRGDSADEEYRQGLGQALRAGGFTAPIALSVMVFCALCCQCASTLVVIRRETNSWRWPVFTFVYMTVLAYLGALVVFQIGHWLGG
jgi:ferrous iron transport protein B